jgi:CheY-like chemotaxis protein
VQSFNQAILCPVCENTNNCLSPCTDIIITDFEMPHINGIELLRHQAQRKCPINIKNKAIMSGVLPEKYIDQIDGLADYFFKKPFSLSEIGAWSKECLSRIDLSQPYRKSTFDEIYLDC